jgi:hypothetical protein
MTNNNGFWIRWLNLLKFLYNCNQLWQLTINDCLRLAPFLAGLHVSSLLHGWHGSDFRVGHFFSFRCPPVNTPQLKTQLLNCLLNSFANESLEFTNELSFITSGEANRGHNTEHFMILSLVSVAAETIEPLPSKWASASVAIPYPCELLLNLRWHKNVLTEPLTTNGHSSQYIDICICRYIGCFRVTSHHLGNGCLVCVCVRLFCVCVVLYLERALSTGRSHIQGVLPIVYRSNKNEKPQHCKSTI